MFKANFYCRKCDSEFAEYWNFGRNITCPHCGTEYETKWDYGSDRNIYPRIDKEVKS
jgi:Zn finger protein HypA/HybF involved in hydrogenase expression